MAVTLDAVGTTHVTANAAVTKDLTTLTVGSGSNRALVVQISWSNTLPTGITVVWDQGGTNQSCTSVATASNTANCSTAIYGLVAPTSGAKTLRVTWTGSRDIYLQAVSWTGVDQTGGATSFPGGAGFTGSNTTPTSTITSAVGDAVMAVHDTNTATLLSVNNTSTFIDNVAPNLAGGGNLAAGAASVVLTATLNVSATWASCGTSIKASVGGVNTIMFADQARS